MIYLQACREAYMANEIYDVGWVNMYNNVADGFTKLKGGPHTNYHTCREPIENGRPMGCTPKHRKPGELALLLSPILLLLLYLSPIFLCFLPPISPTLYLSFLYTNHFLFPLFHPSLFHTPSALSFAKTSTLQPLLLLRWQTYSCRTF